MINKHEQKICVLNSYLSSMHLEPHIRDAAEAALRSLIPGWTVQTEQAQPHADRMQCDLGELIEVLSFIKHKTELACLERPLLPVPRRKVPA